MWGEGVACFPRRTARHDTRNAAQTGTGCHRNPTPLILSLKGIWCLRHPLVLKRAPPPLSFTSGMHRTCSHAPEFWLITLGSGSRRSSRVNSSRNSLNLSLTCSQCAVLAFIPCSTRRGSLRGRALARGPGPMLSIPARERCGEDVSMVAAVMQTRVAMASRCLDREFRSARWASTPWPGRNLNRIRLAGAAG